MHYDHAGNIDLFPNARFHIQDREMAYVTGRCMCHSHIRDMLEGHKTLRKLTAAGADIVPAPRSAGDAALFSAAPGAHRHRGAPRRGADGRSAEARSKVYADHVWDTGGYCEPSMPAALMRAWNFCVSDLI